MSESLRLAYVILNVFESILSLSCISVHLYYRHHNTRGIIEISQAQITKKDNVLIVGSGAVPHTAVRIAMKTGAKVTAIDNRSGTIKQAERSIQCFNITPRPQVLLEDGMTVDLSPYNVVFVTMHVLPKGPVINRIIQDAQPGTRIIFRDPPENMTPFEEAAFVSCRGRQLEIKQIKDPRLHPFRTYVIVKS